MELSLFWMLILPAFQLTRQVDASEVFLGNEHVSKQLQFTKNHGSYRLKQTRLANNELLMKHSIEKLILSVLPKAGSVFTTKQLPNQKLLPEVGNGHLAGVVFGESIFMNGLYNGYNITSHRARIPSTISYVVKNTSPLLPLISYSLDVGRGIFIESHKGQGVQVDIRKFAHRQLSKVLVVEVTLYRSNVSTDVSINLSLNTGSPSSDVTFVDSTDGVKEGTTNIAEYPEISNTTKFYMKTSQSLLKNLTMDDGVRSQTFLFLTSIDVDRDVMLADYETARAMFQNNSLVSSHIRQWSKIWMSGRVDVEGDENLSKLNYGAFYYIYSSLPFDTPRKQWPFIGLSPGGLAHGLQGKDFYGHVFWDQDTWMTPSLMLLHSEVSQTLAKTRTRTLDASKLLAKRTGWKGARYAWESAFTGLETCPLHQFSDYQVHISGDVSRMLNQYFQLTYDVDFLCHQRGLEVVIETAKFWASRVTYSDFDDSYRILDVMPPDEHFWPVNDSIYTNFVAAFNLRLANKLAIECGQKINKSWAEIADKMHLVYDSKLNLHPEFEGFLLNSTVKQADVALLNYPLGLPMNKSTLMNDLITYEKLTPLEHVPAMTWSVFLINWLTLGDVTRAQRLFYRSVRNSHPPFNVWSEDADGGGTVNFLTGQGGHLQALLFGYGGCRIHDNKLSFNPILVPNTTSVSFIGIDYRGCEFNMLYNNVSINITLTSCAGNSSGLKMKSIKGSKWVSLLNNKTFQINTGAFEIITADKLNLFS